MTHTRVSHWAIATGLVCATLGSNALATVTQPNGMVMPQDSNNGEVQLYSLFASLGEPINYQTDGTTQPAIFSPLCGFTATYVLHQAGSSLSVGWYNVDPNASSPPTDIHIIVPAGSPVGTVITGSDIKNDPAYKGGMIGFALVGMQTHYTEDFWNPWCTACSPAAPWVTAVIYPSKTTPNAYYVAFEDGPVSSSSFNNDGDYNDYVYLFKGLVCSGGGEPCDSGKPGVCAQGITECGPGGAVNCTSTVAPGPETCDGLDNDCNGQIDEGAPCETGYVCDKGACVTKCQGEFSCTGGKTCNTDGFCVEPSCANVSCDPGKLCVQGTCTAPCDNVVCPQPLVCRVGACVDPCAGVNCEAGKVCDKGACVTACGCAPCVQGLACETSSGLCKDPSCVDVACGAGTVCQAGTCVDACAGATCPAGQACQQGQCVDDGSGSSGSGGGGVGGLGNSGSGGIKLGSGGKGGSAGSVERGSTDAASDSGCGCGAAGGGGNAGIGPGLAGLLALSRMGRRRRRPKLARPR